MSLSGLLLSDNGKCEILGGDPPEQSQDPCEEVSVPRAEDRSETQRKDDTAEGCQRISKLDAFQEKQKLIEEQNRKKKEMLVRAINDRKKKTDSEARKLDLVNQELQKIDLMLTSDVRFLRDSIEQASIDFTEAQKRYDKAEREFVDAKINLHNCAEKKELLTDHLSAIIEQVEHITQNYHFNKLLFIERASKIKETEHSDGRT